MIASEVIEKKSRRWKAAEQFHVNINPLVCWKRTI